MTIEFLHPTREELQRAMPELAGVVDLGRRIDTGKEWNPKLRAAAHDGLVRAR
jgi:hypothetical protein